MKPYFLLLLTLLFNVGCAQSSSKPITEVSQNELDNVILVDVRTPEEYASGHIENSQNINLYDTAFESRFKDIAKDETIYVYCKVGGRSAQAQQKLNAMGFTNVVNLEGGYDAWVKVDK